MKKVMIGAVLLITLVTAACSESKSQTLQGSIPAEPALYTVQPGDTAWQLGDTKLGDPLLWEEIVKSNPFLQEKGRVTKKGPWMYVLIHPGEKLAGLEKLGIFPEKAPLPVVDKPLARAGGTYDLSPWWLLLLLIPVAAWLWFSRRVLNAPAATSGPAMVPGGVNDETAAARFAEEAVRQHFTTLSRTSGRITGVLMTAYANGRTLPRILRNERAYRADVRHADGTLETLYMLQACGNDLRYGGISRYLPGPGFSFTADPEVVPTPVAEPVPEAVPAPSPIPVDWNAIAERVEGAAPDAAALASEEAAGPAMADGDFVFDFDRGGEGQPILARVVGLATQKITLTSRGDVLTFRVTR